MDIKKLRVATLKIVMRGSTQKAFAEKYGFNASYLSQIINGHRDLGERTAVFLEDKIGLRRGTLVFPMALDDSFIERVLEETGLANIAAADTSQPDVARHAKKVIDISRSRLPVLESAESGLAQTGSPIDVVWITHSGFSSHGKDVRSIPESEQYARINSRYLQEIGFKFSKAADLKLVNAWDQSMQPTINQNDLLIVDVSVNKFVGDGVYLIAWGGRSYVKRLQVLDEYHYELISDNAKYKDRIVSCYEISVEGRVGQVWRVQAV